MQDNRYHFTLLRHGESEGNLKQLFQGQLDYPLSESGKRQAAVLARRWQLEEASFDRIVASPLSRAQETAEIIAAQLGLAVETDPLWMEQDFGEMNTLSIPEVVQDPQRPRFFTAFARAGRTGESKMQTFIRAGQALHTLLDRPPGRYLIISHGALLNMVLYNALGIFPHPSAEGPWFAFHNTAFATLSYNPARHIWTVQGINDIHHLDEPLTPSGDYHIHFVRHAESEGNANGLWQGRADYPLTPRGRAQAAALAQRWKREETTFDHAIASPLSRARHTAEIITTALGLPLELDPIWVERDNGLYAGTTPENRNPPEPDYYPLHHPIGETGETLWELYIRGCQALNTILRRPPGRYLIVSHGGILNMTLYAALGITPMANFQGVRFAFHNASFAHLTYTAARNRWQVLAVDDSLHLHDHS